MRQSSMAVIDCRHFNGYKPCGLSKSCNESCSSKDIPQNRILVVHLEALGAVLRATSVLKPIKRKYPGAHITWVTQKPAEQLLLGNPLIDRVLTTERDDLLSLSALEFDVAMVIDKGLKASGVLAYTNADLTLGFVANPRTGAIEPANVEAEELWEVGLSDQVKFYENKKPETQLITESLALDYSRDEYILELSTSEQELARVRRTQWVGTKKTLVGINTGCSQVLPYKKLSVDGHRRLISLALEKFSDRIEIVLLGGKEDSERNIEIAKGLNVQQSPTGLGIRDGIVSVEACDLVFTGDSLGMHMAIARKKYVVAWFGPTCAHEIDLYNRGEAILTRAPCAPCWKRSCDKTPMCYDQLDWHEVMASINKGIDWHLKSLSYKPLSSETFSSPLP